MNNSRLKNFSVTVISNILAFLLTVVINTVEFTDAQLPGDFLSSKDPVTDIFSLAKVLTRRNDNPGSLLNTTTIVNLYGYPVEEYKVITSDGYILTMYRVPHGKNETLSQKDKKRPIAFLQHGLFGSSFEWFMNMPEKLLALTLADSGWDVWLGNSRGNAYSRQHLTLSPNDKKFWEFSFHEMGDKDLPAQIDFVLNKTGQSYLRYVGYSMGTTMLWTMMSLHPEYNDKVKVMVALAPVAYINNTLGITRFIAPFWGILKYFLDIIGNGEYLPPWLLQLVNSAGARFCSNPWIAETICINIIFFYAGWDLPQTQIKQLPLFYSHTPSPTATRTLAHMAQLIDKGDFAEYDFGREENELRYGQSVPPKYSLKNTTIPVALIWGANDADVKRLASDLPNVVYNAPVNFPLWNHFDYHLGKDVNELVNNLIIKLLNSF